MPAPLRSRQPADKAVHWYGPPQQYAMNITLIGMPGSGKSFVGKQLADRLGFTLIGVDKIIEKEFGLRLPQVVETLGNERFLDTEAEAVLKHTSGLNNLVISPGGSVIYRRQAMEHLKKISTVFYLNVPLDVLEERIGTVPRGVVIAKGKTFADVYAERAPLYEKSADYVLQGDSDPETIIETIRSTMNGIQQP